MNCKPEDLAVIVYSDSTEYIGRLVTVLHPGDQYGDGLFHWRIRVEGSAVFALIYEADNEPRPGVFSVTNEVDFPDAHMRPIRDPGDDAVDETLTWKYQADRIAREVFA